MERNAENAESASSAPRQPQADDARARKCFRVALWSIWVHLELSVGCWASNRRFGRERDERDERDGRDAYEVQLQQAAHSSFLTVERVPQLVARGFGLLELAEGLIRARDADDGQK